MKIFLFFVLVLFLFNSYSQEPGNALDFDGSNDIVNCGSNSVLDDLQSFTVEAWINPRSFGGGENGIIVQKRDVVVGYWMLSMQNTGGEAQIEFIVNCTSPARARSAQGSVELNRWMHVAAVFNGATYETSLYINGEEVDYDMHVTGSGTHFPDADNSMFIGSNANSTRIFDGAIDEVRVWNVTKTEVDIYNSFRNVVSPSSSGLIAYYKFNEGTPCADNTGITSLPDQTVYANNGVLSGFDLSTADCTSNWIGSYAMVTPLAIDPAISGCEQISLSWYQPELGSWDAYYLEVAEDVDFVNRLTDYNPYKNVGTALSEAVTGLTPGQEYFYRVRAYNSTTGDIGAYSLVKSIVLEDLTDPVISCPGDQLIDKNSACEALVPDFSSLVTATDNCSTPSITQSPAAGTTVSVNTNVTLTATDDFSNTASCSFQLILEDNSAPDLVCPGNQTQSSGMGCDVILADYTSLVSVSDNCDATPTISQSPVAGTTISTSTLITVIATDDDGNESECTFYVTPADATPPSITCPGNIAEPANENCELVLPDYTTDAVVSDLCDAYPTVTQDPAPGTIVSSTTTVTLEATDAGNNTSSCSFIVSIEDVTPPTGTNPGDQGVTPNALCNANLPDFRSLIGAVDNCDASVTVNQVPTIGTPMTGTTEVTLYAIDNDGNYSTFVFNAYIDDSTNPTINGPGDQNFYAPENCEVIVEDYTGMAMVNDNCDNDPEVTQIPAPGSVISETTTVTLTATDASGNQGTHQFDLIVNDITNPTIDCPEAYYGCPASNWVIYDVLAEDNCSVTLEQTAGLSSGSEFPVGETVNTFVATDGAGNTATCSFSVFIIEHPQLDLQDDTICAYEDYTIDATPSEPGTYAYEWSDFQNTPSIVVNLEPGLYYYYVTVTNQAGCYSIDTAFITVEICEGVRSTTNPEIKIYPNPVKDILYLNSKSSYQFRILDVSAKPVFEDNYVEANESIDCSGLKPGVYVIELINNEEKVYLRFVKE